MGHSFLTILVATVVAAAAVVVVIFPVFTRRQRIRICAT